MLACFDPSVEQVFKERVQMHRNLERLIAGRRKREPENPKLAPKPEPTLENVRTDWKETPVNVIEEVTDLVGECLWDVFSDNHEVIAADQRVVDIGSFRGASGSWMRISRDLRRIGNAATNIASTWERFGFRNARI